MKIIFFGSSEFAVASLKALLAAGEEISCVVTQPDKPKGRGLHFEGTAVKKLAQETGLKVYQPSSINTPESIKFLKNLNPDLFTVIAYGQIFSKDILNIPKIFSLNIHASLLPKYRGAAPINWVIIKGEKITGITTIKMMPGLDAGPIILQKTTEVNPDDTSITLADKLSVVAAQLLVETLKLIKSNNYKLAPQDEAKVSFAPELKKPDGLIDWDKPAGDIDNLIRGCVSWPGAFTYYKGKLWKIHQAKAIPLSGYPVIPLPGKIIEVSREGILVATGKEGLIIEELQMEGKRRMSVAEFIAGHKIEIGEKLEKKIA